ncbi:MAG TPA: RidA family protein [Anaeromyxobacteraceae bacterium]|nr:RidA family protein [Anaeromyxobacteraceae bacterium]
MRRMSMKTIATCEAPSAIGPYSQAVLLERSGGTTLYCSGQIALDAATGDLVRGDIAAQTERVMQNIEAVLRAAGLGFEHVVKATIFLVDLADFARMNEVYGRKFSGRYPARSTVQVAALPRGALVEIDVTAEGPQGRGL